MIGSSSPLPEVGGAGGGGWGPPLDRRLLPDMRRFILGSLASLVVVVLATFPRDEQDEEVIGIEADCWMRILEVGLEEPLVGVGSYPPEMLRMMMGFWRCRSDVEEDVKVGLGWTPVDRVTIEWLRFSCSERLLVAVVELELLLTLLVLPFWDLIMEGTPEEEDGDEDEVVMVVVGDCGVVADPLWLPLLRKASRSTSV